MNRVVSYSYFRNANSCYEKQKGNSALQFEQFLALLVRAHHVLWSGWRLRIAHDDEVTKLPYFQKLERMAGSGLLELAPFGKSKTLCGLTGMLERMRPIFEGDAEVVVCRDIDVIPAPFDRRAVEEWLASGKAVHVVHWSKEHSGYMGGTTSVRSARFRELIHCNSLEKFIERGATAGLSYHIHGDDQHLLNNHMPLMARETLVHDLHHIVGDMPGCEIRTKISDYTPDDILKASFKHDEADHLSPGCGICWEPAEALKFYDAIDSPIIRSIQMLEKG